MPRGNKFHFPVNFYILTCEDLDPEYETFEERRVRLAPLSNGESVLDLFDDDDVSVLHLLMGFLTCYRLMSN
jgi:hypothetical protein